MGFDEMTHFTWFMVQYLMTRVRSSVPGSWCRIRCASNPGNIGHGWVKKYFGIDKVPINATWTPEATAEDPQPMSRAFIPSKVTDNPYIMLNDPHYIRRLAQLPKTQRAMLLDGDWSSFEGRFFSEFGPEHIVKRFDIPKHWKVYRAVDYGFTAPFCCLWFAADTDGHYYAFQELYQSGLRDTQQALMIQRFSKDMNVEYTVGDPSMGNKNSSGTSPQENYMAAADIALVPGDNHRIPGWMALRNLLAKHPKDGKPVLQIFENCVNLKRELEEGITDSRNPEDLNTDGSDHAVDAARYFAMSRPSGSTLPEDDPYKNMDRATQSEWKAYHAKIKAMSLQGQKAILSDLNREGESGDTY